MLLEFEKDGQIIGTTTNEVLIAAFVDEIEKIISPRVLVVVQAEKSGINFAVNFLRKTMKFDVDAQSWEISYLAQVSDIL